ncbi:MAG: dTDP-4-dehydrorhamnose reductase [Odoribacter sp.]|nr:dTDP-4-dehydrorhamnose reductase [Odoribacter sp.]
MANILVTGANGQLGSELRKIGFSVLDEVFFTDVDELDITDYRAIEDFIQRHEIDTIINCAAYTAVDKAEEEPEKAARINTEAVANLAKAAAKEDCLLIHISTDYVFDGTATEPYTEKTKTCPVSVYGRTKLAGEEAIKKSGCFYIIIRTAWLYSTFGNNFVKTILRLAAERSELTVVADQVGSPTYAEDLAKAIVKIMDNEERIEHEGIYHFSNEGACSWFDFATEIVRLGNAACKVRPVTTDEYPTKTKRPAYSVLDKSKIRKTFAVEVPDWKEALQRMMRQLETVKQTE